MTRPDVVDASLEAAPVVDRDGYAYVIHPLTDGVPRCEPAILRAWVDWARQQVARLELAPTVLLAPEAMALPLAAALALEMDLPYLVVRKRAYGLPGERVVGARTGYSTSRLHLNDIRSDDRVLILDDVLSTGGTMDAILAALHEHATVEGVLVFLDKGLRRFELSARHGTPVVAMRTIDVTEGRVKVTGEGKT